MQYRKVVYSKLIRSNPVLAPLDSPAAQHGAAGLMEATSNDSGAGACAQAAQTNATTKAWTLIDTIMTHRNRSQTGPFPSLRYDEGL